MSPLSLSPFLFSSSLSPFILDPSSFVHYLSADDDCALYYSIPETNGATLHIPSGRYEPGFGESWVSPFVSGTLVRNHLSLPSRALSSSAGDLTCAPPTSSFSSTQVPRLHCWIYPPTQASTCGCSAFCFAELDLLLPYTPARLLSSRIRYLCRQSIDDV